MIGGLLSADFNVAEEDPPFAFVGFVAGRQHQAVQTQDRDADRRELEGLAHRNGQRLRPLRVGVSRPARHDPSVRGPI